ncbi:MAG: hypothetical protein ABSB49_01670 [Polyangia bacterium]
MRLIRRPSFTFLLLSASAAVLGCSQGGTSGGKSGSAKSGSDGSVATGGAASSGGTTATGAATARGGNAGSGGATAAGGGPGAGGTWATGGAPPSSGASPSGGVAATGGSTAAPGGAIGVGARSGGGSGAATGGASPAGGTLSGGAANSAGAYSSGGVIGSGGVTGKGGSSSDADISSTCGKGTTPAANPFGCAFAWGVEGNPASYLQFASTWAGYNIQADGTFPANGFDSGSWLASFTTGVPAYYAYIIGYYGHANGFPDGNVNPNGPNLSNSMGPLLLGVDNAGCPSGTICDQNLMVKAYAWYAAQTYAVFQKPVIWLLEGDFIQYSIEGSSSGLSYAQLGQLAAQITLAIKCNDPPAVVAIDYSTWITSAQLTSFIGGIDTAMAALGTSYDMIWTTGAGTSSYANLNMTGKSILVDESFGLSAQSDTWANQTAGTINARIAEGVVAANITTATPSYLQTNVTTTLAPSALSPTCP